MMVTSKINTILDKPINSHYNVWADYIELSCLRSEDKLVTIDDIVDHYIDEKSIELERGNSEHAEKIDRIFSSIKDHFIYLKFRESTLKQSYPFIIYEDSIELKDHLNLKNDFYFFLLFSSNLSYFEKSTLSVLTSSFEEISCEILKEVFSPLAKTHIFGTSRKMLTENHGEANYEGNLKKRITELGKKISSDTTKKFDESSGYSAGGGDGGLDLISYIPMDGNPFIPISFAQCACSYSQWKEKQYSINYDTWRSRLDNISPYLQFTFVPFYFRDADGNFMDNTVINTCLYDRLRIFKVLRRKILKKFKKHDVHNTTKEIFQELMNYDL